MNFQRVRIVDCKPQDKYKLWLRFDDGISGIVDLSELVGKGVFAAWNSIQFFNMAHIDPKTDTVAWGEDLDLDPYVLREKIELQRHV